MTAPSSEAVAEDSAYRHEAFLYADDDDFMCGTVPFLRDAVARDEPALVVLSAAKIKLIRDALDSQADPHVTYADMDEVGVNPARIIPVWQDFIDRNEQSGRPLRGIGEPIRISRRGPELVECQRHEALLNTAFAGTVFWLRCPYDVGSLPQEVVAEAHRTHPYVVRDSESRSSTSYPGADALAVPSTESLPAPPPGTTDFDFAEDTLPEVRRVVAEFADPAGLAVDRISELVVAVNEVATNSVVHGGGNGTLRLWRDGRTLLCEIRDAGSAVDPLADRRRPDCGSDGGRGLWLANQFCELVQIRATGAGNVVRMHVRLP